MTQKWYEFGKAIGIETELLDRYTECTPDQSIVEVCDYWFRSHTGQPTWREVANALKKIRLHQLAIDIEKVYETGMYEQLGGYCGALHHAQFMTMFIFP